MKVKAAKKAMWFHQSTRDLEILLWTTSFFPFTPWLFEQIWDGQTNVAFICLDFRKVKEKPENYSKNPEKSTKNRKKWQKSEKEKRQIDGKNSKEKAEKNKLVGRGMKKNWKKRN